MPTLACPHRPPCPGCPRFGEETLDETAWASLHQLAERAAVPLRAVRGASTGHRHRARLAIRGRASAPKLGIFEENSHRVVQIPQCAVHHPVINRVVAGVRRALVSAKVPPYSDTAQAGVARYVSVAVERRSQTTQVTFVGSTGAFPERENLFRELEREIGRDLHSLFFNLQPDPTNAIFGPRFSRVMGPEALEETFAGARAFFPPGAFGQNHLPLFERLVEHVHAWVPPGARVLELYSGVGAIGLGLVNRATRVAFNEVNPHSLQGLAWGLDALSEELRSRTEVLSGPAGAFAGHVAEADVVIADPPRKGLDPEVLAALGKNPVAHFVYVSCALGSFLSQTEALLGSGYRITDLTAFDMFPFTGHVETVAHFVRS